MTSFARSHVHAFVADAPVNAPIRPDGKPVHVVSPVGDVQPEAVDEKLAHVRYSVVVGVLEAPEVRRDGRINPAVVVKDTRRNSCDFRVKPVCEHRDFIRNAVAIGVAQLIDAVGEDR